MNKEFERFLKTKRQASDSVDAVDWEKKKIEWLEHLEKLYETVEDALAEYKKKGSLEIRFEDVDLTEEHIGTYTARMMKIVLGRESILLKPVGTILIAAKGKVEMEGAHDTVSLVLVDSRLKKPGDSISVEIPAIGEKSGKKKRQTEGPIRWVWKFVIGPPYREFLPVTEDTLLKKLMEVSDGE